MKRQRIRKCPRLTNANRSLILKYSCGIYKIFSQKASYCVPSLLLLFLGGCTIMSAIRKNTHSFGSCPWKERKEARCYKRATTSCSCLVLPDLKTQLQKYLPGIKATNKCSFAREKVNGFQPTLVKYSQKILTRAKCSQKDSSP